MAWINSMRRTYLLLIDIIKRRWIPKLTKTKQACKPNARWWPAIEFWCPHLKDLKNTYFVVYSMEHRLADHVCPLCVKKYSKDMSIDLYEKMDEYKVPQYKGKYVRT